MGTGLCLGSKSPSTELSACRQTAKLVRSGTDWDSYSCFDAACKWPQEIGQLPLIKYSTAVDKLTRDSARTPIDECSQTVSQSSKPALGVSPVRHTDPHAYFMAHPQPGQHDHCHIIRATYPQIPLLQRRRPRFHKHSCLLRLSACSKRSLKTHISKVQVDKV
jgi:hypothetical protein